LARALAKEQVFGKRRGQLAVLVLVRREMLQMPWPHTAMVYVCMQALNLIAIAGRTGTVKTSSS